MTNDETTALERFNEIDAAVWFDIARNGFRYSDTIHYRDRKFSLDMGRAKQDGGYVSESQARRALSLLERIEKLPRKTQPGPHERLKSSFQLSLPNALAAAKAATKGRPAR